MKHPQQVNTGIGDHRHMGGAGNIIIRTAQEPDLDRVIVIEAEAFPDPWDLELLEDLLFSDSGISFVAVNGGSVVGFVVAEILEVGDERYGHIMNLAVDAPFRKRGVGNSLVRRVEQEFVHMAAGAVQLEVRASNRAAQEFYLRMGYQGFLTFDSYYENGEPALVMMKWLRY